MAYVSIAPLAMAVAWLPLVLRLRSRRRRLRVMGAMIAAALILTVAEWIGWYRYDVTWWFPA